MTNQSFRITFQQKHSVEALVSYILAPITAWDIAPIVTEDRGVHTIQYRQPTDLKMRKASVIISFWFQMKVDATADYDNPIIPLSFTARERLGTKFLG